MRNYNPHDTNTPPPPAVTKTTTSSCSVTRNLALEPEPERSLAQLEVEESAVGEAEGGAGGLGEVGRQHGHGAMPPPGAAAELPDVVEVRSCKDGGHKASRAAAAAEKSTAL